MTASLLTFRCERCGDECFAPNAEIFGTLDDPEFVCARCLARERIVAEALSWLRTPFHHEARVKGERGGVDCAMLLAEVYERAGQIPRAMPEHYPHDWHLHRDEEKYLAWILKHAVEIEDPLPGDVAIFKIGRTWSHAGIVVEWPTIIHAWFATSVELNDASKEPLRTYPKKFFTLRNWKP